MSLGWGGLLFVLGWLVGLGCLLAAFVCVDLLLQGFGGLALVPVIGCFVAGVSV